MCAANCCYAQMLSWIQKYYDKLGKNSVQLCLLFLCCAHLVVLIKPMTKPIATQWILMNQQVTSMPPSSLYNVHAQAYSNGT